MSGSTAGASAVTWEGTSPSSSTSAEHVQPGRDHSLAVRLDNRDNPITGPKPLAQLDFNLYHGLYRSVVLVQKDRLHFTDPLLADRPAGGGVFVTYPEVSRERARVRVQTHVANRYDGPRDVQVRVTLRSRRRATSPRLRRRRRWRLDRGRTRTSSRTSR